MKHAVSNIQKGGRKGEKCCGGASSEVGLSQSKFMKNCSGSSNKAPLTMEALAPKKSNSFTNGRQDFQRAF